MKTIAVVGAGAVGLYYGSRLALAGEDVSFLLRSDFDAVSHRGIQLESVHGDAHLERVKAERSPEEIGPVDLVILAWKATSNGALERVLPPLCHPRTIVLTLQNGLGNCETLASLVGADRVLGGLCFVCLNRLEPGVVRHTAGGKVTMGEWQPQDGGERVKDLVHRFKQAGIPSAYAEELQAAQWRKLVWNIPFNGLSIAEGGVTTDRLLADAAIENEIRHLMEEVIQAAGALGYPISRDEIDVEIERTRGMDAYRPSSMIDYEEGREVEFDAIWAEPLRRARRCGVPVPHLEALVGRIQDRLAARG